MNTYPAASVELLPLTVAVDGTPTTTYQVAIVPAGTASTDITTWASSVAVDTDRGVMVADLTPGIWAVWTKVTGNPETPVMLNAYILITP